MPEARAVTRTTVILSFHKIGEPPAKGWQTWNYIDESTFGRFLEELREECYHVLDLPAFLGGMKNPALLPERSALLTFDDGYKSMLSVAQPVLGQFGVPSVLFVPTAFIGRTNEWDRDNEPEEPLADWDELEELQGRGVAIQSHSVSHRNFDDLDLEEQEHEIRRSKELLEDRLGTGVTAFAFPYGNNGRHVAAMEKVLRDSGYEASFLYKGGAFDLPTETPHRITRLPMGPDTDLAARLGGTS